MKRVSLFILLLAFTAFATISCSYADSSPPGVETSIENDYEFPGNIDLTETNFTGVAGIQTEGRIAVYDCDLKIWPDVDESINYNSNNVARVNSVYDDVLYWPTESETSLYTKNSLTIKAAFKTQYRVFVDKNEVLSMFELSKGERFSARNEVT